MMRLRSMFSTTINTVILGVARFGAFSVLCRRAVSHPPVPIRFANGVDDRQGFEAMRSAMAPVGRGVWVAPHVGKNGEMWLMAMTSKRVRVAEMEVPLGASHLDASDKLWSLLEEAEPDPRAHLRII